MKKLDNPMQLSFNYTEITEVNLSAFVYRLFHEDFSSLVRMSEELSDDE